MTTALQPRAASPDLTIVGLSFGYHDSACALLRDGRRIAAAQEERFSRVKNDRSFPAQALRYCLREAWLGSSTPSGQRPAGTAGWK